MAQPYMVHVVRYPERIDDPDEVVSKLKQASVKGGSLPVEAARDAVTLIRQLQKQKRAALSEVNRIRHAEHVRRSGSGPSVHSHSDLE